MNHFTQEDMDFFVRHSNKLYNKEISDHVNAGLRIRKTIFDKVSFWGERVANELGFTYLKRNNWVNSYHSTFSGYAWCRIFPDPNDHQLFFNVECNAEEESLIIKLHCKFSGSDKLSHEKVVLFDKYIESKFYIGQWLRWYIIDIDTFENFEQLINFSKHFIQDNLHYYHEVKRLLDNSDLSDLKEEIDNLELELIDLTEINLKEVEKITPTKKDIPKGYIFEDKTIYESIISEPLSIYEKQDRENKKLGDIGEKLILIQEQKKLKELQEKGIVSLDKKIIKQKDFVGYDILSYDLNGEEIHIEVKTTKGNDKSPFYMSMNEVYVMKQDSKWRLYRVHNFNASKKTANFFIWDALQVELNVDFLNKIYYCRFK